MNSIVLALVFCGLVGKASAALTQDAAAALTIEYTATNVLFKCQVTGGFSDTADKLAITKDGGTVVFETAAANTEYSFVTDVATRTVPKASHTTADYGSYTCQMQLGDASESSATSAAVVLPACSAAPRVVESLSLALVCVLATVLKSHM